MKRIKVSASIICFNESAKLSHCLESIKNFVDEIVIIDLGSTDGLEIVAKKYKAKVIYHQRLPYADPIRNFAISKTSGDWVLILDPDERVPITLARKLREFIQFNQDFIALNIPTKNIFFDKWISHTNFWPDRHIRFFKKGSVVWSSKLHSYPKIKGDVFNLPADESLSLEHVTYPTWKGFLSKQIHYARLDAENKFKQNMSFSVKDLFWMPAREFLARFIKHQGYKDGLDGLFIVISLMIYRILTQFYLLSYQLFK